MIPSDRLSQFYLACLAGALLVMVGIVVLHSVGAL